MKRLFLLSLAALLTATGCHCAKPAKSADNFTRWEAEITAFERADRTNPPPRGAILFAGSSTIRLWKTLATDFPEHRIINRGFGGSEIADSTHFADRIILPCAPRMIVFRAGGNDLWNGKSPKDIFADFKQFVATVQSKLPGTEIAFLSWTATPARWTQRDKEKTLNALVTAYAKETPGVRFIEMLPLPAGPDGMPGAGMFASDKLHFSPAGYKLLAESVRPHLPAP
jgi:lysophospholipase L1-like esterase